MSQRRLSYERNFSLQQRLINLLKGGRPKTFSRDFFFIRITGPHPARGRYGRTSEPEQETLENSRATRLIHSLFQIAGWISIETWDYLTVAQKP